MSTVPQRDPREPPAAAAADRYRALLEAASTALVITDLAGLIVEANSAAARLLAVEQRFLIGKPIQLYADAGVQRVLRRFVVAVAAGEARHVELRLRRRTGVPFDASVDAVAHAGEIMWTLQDMSSQRLAEEQLWELNRALEEEVRLQAGEIVTILDELPIGVVTVDAATGAIRRANPAAQQVLGVGPGQTLDDVDLLDTDGAPLPPGERPGVHALAGRRTEGRRFILAGPDGERQLEVSAVPLRGPLGAVTGAVFTVDDVTARVRREQAEREFVSNAAHQLRSPLTAITSAMAVLRRDEELDSETRRRFLDHVERETERMVRLTHGLLTLARVDRDGIRPRPSVVPVEPLLEELARAAPDGAEVTVEADVAAAAVANEELLVEALMNLVQNAVRYGGGRVTLRGRRVSGDVVLEVSDEGTGMEPEVLERVFDRFYRADRVAGTGSGLGLPIARAAARAAGGQLTIESHVGVGTTARIRLTGATIL